MRWRVFEGSVIRSYITSQDFMLRTLIGECVNDDDYDEAIGRQ